MTCKWTHLAHERRWDESYFKSIGLGDLVDQKFDRVGIEIVPAGNALASGSTVGAAADLGLRAGTPVGAGLIDAHAGGVGTVGARGGSGAATTRMAYVFGTSACTMASSTEPVFIPGVWGPYKSAMMPELWLSEGGQSGAGAAIEQLICLHPAAAEARETTAAAGISLATWLAGTRRPLRPPLLPRRSYWPADCMWFPISWATDHRLPIRMLAQSSQGSAWSAT